MRALLLGGSGLLGGAAREALLAAGWEVWALTRRALPPAPGLRHIAADRYDGAALASALRGQSFALTVDFLAYEADQLDLVLRVPGFDPGRLVVISTGQVYLVTGRAPPYAEADADHPAIPEPAPETRAWYNWRYGVGKRAVEARLLAFARERGVPTLALRVPAVHGEADGRSSGRLWAWLERFLDGGPVLLPEGGVQPVRFVYAGDVGAALARLGAGEGWPAGAALNLAMPETCSLADFLGLAARCAGCAPTLLPIDRETLEGAGLDESSAPFWGPFNSRPDPALAQSLGFTLRGPASWLPGVVAAHLAERPPSHDGYVNRPRELALARALTGRG